MTDRYSALTVTLEHDLRDDDAQALINAIKQLRFVLDVQPHTADPMEQSVAEMRLKTELYEKISDIFWTEKQ